MMTDGTLRFAENLVELVSGYTAAAFENLEVKPDRVIHIAPGASIAWDENCSGQLWGRVATIEPGKPVQGAARACGITHFYATVELGILRCVATLDEDGSAPSAETIENEGIAAAGDLAALLQAVLCQPKTYQVIRYIPEGPNGGYAGGAWSFLVRLENCVDCDG